MTTTDEFWYRYVDCKGLEGPTVELLKLPVVRHTPAGVWITNWGREVWVSKHTRKRFAYPTIDLAWESFKIRKTYQRSYLIAQLKHVEDVLNGPEWPTEPTNTFW